MRVKMVWGAVFEVVDCTSKTVPRLEAQMFAMSRVRMGRLGEIREWFSSAEGGKLAKTVCVFQDFDVTYQDAITNRRFRIWGTPKSTHSRFLHRML